jgi:hypothetical protein
VAGAGRTSASGDDDINNIEYIDMNNIEPMIHNVYRTNISRRRVYNKNKRTKLSLEAQAMSICKEAVDERYIHNSFSKFDSGYVYYDRDEDEMMSFCLWKIYNDMGQKRLHIFIISKL